MKYLKMIYQKDLFHTLLLKKKIQNSRVKLRNPVCNKKIYLYSKYIKSKINLQIQNMILRLFCLVYDVNK